jgi:hypothetical protein
MNDFEDFLSSADWNCCSSTAKEVEVDLGGKVAFLQPVSGVQVE